MGYIRILYIEPFIRYCKYNFLHKKKNDGINIKLDNLI